MKALNSSKRKKGACYVFGAVPREYWQGSSYCLMRRCPLAVHRLSRPNGWTPVTKETRNDDTADSATSHNAEDLTCAQEGTLKASVPLSHKFADDLSICSQEEVFAEQAEHAGSSMRQALRITSVFTALTGPQRR